MELSVVGGGWGGGMFVCFFNWQAVAVLCPYISFYISNIWQTVTNVLCMHWVHRSKSHIFSQPQYLRSSPWKQTARFIWQPDPHREIAQLYKYYISVSVVNDFNKINGHLNPEHCLHRSIAVCVTLMKNKTKSRYDVSMVNVSMLARRKRSCSFVCSAANCSIRKDYYCFSNKVFNPSIHYRRVVSVSYI